MVILDDDLFLNAADLGEKAEVTFIDEGRKIPKDESGFKEDGFGITIKLPNGDKRSWTMNVTSRRMVNRLFTSDTKKWIGKKVTLVTKEQNVKGEMKKCIYVQTEEPKPEVK